jgi:hypothetical protein
MNIKATLVPQRHPWKDAMLEIMAKGSDDIVYMFIRKSRRATRTISTRTMSRARSYNNLYK